MRVRRFLPVVLALLGIALAPTAAAISIGPGVACLTDVGVQYRFETTFHFGNISLSDDRLKLDSLNLMFASNATYYANITRIGYVDHSSATVFVVEWNGTSSLAGAKTWFNISGLSPGVEYTFLVNGLIVVSHTADSFGAVRFNATSTDAFPHRLDVVTSFAAIAGTDWLMFMLIFLLVLLIALGLLDAAGLGGIWLMFGGFIAFFLAIEVYSVTGSLPVSIICAGLGALLLVVGAWKGIAWST